MQEHPKRELPITLKRHGKALVPTVAIGLFIFALNVLTFKYWPADWDYQWIVQIILALFLLVGFGIPLLRWHTETYTITKTAIKNDWGLLYRQSRQIDLTRIASISEERGILDRIFGCGTLNFYDAAAGAQPHTRGLWNKGDNPQAGVRFHDVPKVREVQEIIEEAKNQALRSR